MARPIAVFGIYSDQLSAGDAVDALREAGFRNTDISLLVPENQGTKDFAHEKHSKAPEGAVAGGASGALLGGALGWLAGIGALAIPGIGAFLAAGPVMGMLGGIGVGSTIGGLAGALAGAGIPEYEAKRYEGRIRHGGILLSVHCEDEHRVDMARKILKNTGADDIGKSAEVPVGQGVQHDAHHESVREHRASDVDMLREQPVHYRSYPQALDERHETVRDFREAPVSHAISPGAHTFVDHNSMQPVINDCRPEPDVVASNPTVYVHRDSEPQVVEGRNAQMPPVVDHQNERVYSNGETRSMQDHEGEPVRRESHEDYELRGFDRPRSRD
jgi:hypothetical protein